MVERLMLCFCQVNFDFFFFYFLSLFFPVSRLFFYTNVMRFICTRGYSKKNSLKKRETALQHLSLLLSDIVNFYSIAYTTSSSRYLSRVWPARKNRFFNFVFCISKRKSPRRFVNEQDWIERACSNACRLTSPLLSLPVSPPPSRQINRFRSIS